MKIVDEQESNLHLPLSDAPHPTVSTLENWSAITT
jgi:hypothetical protein